LVKKKGMANHNVVWPSDLQVAPHVLMAYVDISSAGIRALMFLRKYFLDQSISSQSYFGNILSSEVSACAQAWKDCSREVSDNCLEVFTVFNKDRVPVLSLLFVNSMLPVEIITGVAIDLIQGLMARKVVNTFHSMAAYLILISSSKLLLLNSRFHGIFLFQVSRISLVSALRFNPRNSSDEGRIHVLQAQPQESVPHTSLPSECVWDARWRIEDSLLAALLQMLRFEVGRIASECLIAQGHRLPREICLDLPFSSPDPSAIQVRALLGALVHRLAGTWKVEFQLFLLPFSQP
jgi:hypothetical protein